SDPELQGECAKPIPTSWLVMSLGKNSTSPSGGCDVTGLQRQYCIRDVVRNFSAVQCYCAAEGQDPNPARFIIQVESSLTWDNGQRERMEMYDVRVGQVAKLNCSTSLKGTSVSWFSDGGPLTVNTTGEYASIHVHPNMTTVQCFVTSASGLQNISAAFILSATSQAGTSTTTQTAPPGPQSPSYFSGRSHGTTLPPSTIALTTTPEPAEMFTTTSIRTPFSSTVPPALSLDEALTCTFKTGTCNWTPVPGSERDTNVTHKLNDVFPDCGVTSENVFIAHGNMTFVSGKWSNDALSHQTSALTFQTYSNHPYSVAVFARSAKSMHRRQMYAVYYTGNAVCHRKNSCLDIPQDVVMVSMQQQLRAGFNWNYE
ncbi:hypothetical protein BaRGS_00035874, partial [Batillaria attramentaria]